MGFAVRLALWMLPLAIVAYPLSEVIQHGLWPSAWPAEAITIAGWFDRIVHLDFSVALTAYANAALGTSAALASGGWTAAFIVPWLPLAILAVSRSAPPEPARHFSGIFGAARFANASEKGAMRKGVEFGKDTDGVPVRGAVEGTLVSIAPPRKGKTAGLLVPNLAYPEAEAWSGPAVVIDPKGEVFNAVAKRRATMGQRVICLDPLSLVGGRDKWNPIPGMATNDILRMQHIAGALLPQPNGTSSEASAYFRNRAVDLVTGAILAARHSQNRSIVEVQRLLAQEDELLDTLTEAAARARQPAVLSALSVLNADPKTKDPIKSTAIQAFQWLGDRRMRNIVSESTFEISDLCEGDCDLFVAVPPEYKHILAPWLRWILGDLFMTIRRKRPSNRIIIFVDEAAVLGRYDEILTASTELPGYGASLWSFWQDRAQIVELYGEAGASTIVNTAEWVTVSDLGAVDPDESERWSKALGNYTAAVETTSRPVNGKGQTQVSSAPQAAALMTKEALVALPSSKLLVFPNARGYARHPLILDKTLGFDDKRFNRFVQKQAPLKASSAKGK